MYQEQLDEKPKMGSKLRRERSAIPAPEYYLAVKLLQDDANLNVVILDKTLAGEIL